MDTIHSSRTGTFLFNTAKERVEAKCVLDSGTKRINRFCAVSQFVDENAIAVEFLIGTSHVARTRQPVVPAAHARADPCSQVCVPVRLNGK